MKSVVLHIGLHKTGTTYLQNALALNRPTLEEMGFLYYLDDDYLHEWWAHCTLALSIRNEAHPFIAFSEDRRAVWSRFLEKFENSSNDVAVVSAEVFVAGVDVGFVRSQLEGFDTHIVVYLREEVELFGSIYHQQVQSGLGLPMDEFYEHSSARLDFADRLADWEAAYGSSLHLRSYNRVRERGEDLFEDFMSALGLPSSCVWRLPTGRPNHRWPEDLVEIMRRINLLPITEENRRQLRDTLAEMESQNRAMCDLAPLSVPSELAARIRSEKRAGNAPLWERCQTGAALDGPPDPQSGRPG